jgi:hypothetical protein
MSEEAADLSAGIICSILMRMSVARGTQGALLLVVWAVLRHWYLQEPQHDGAAPHTTTGRD